MALPGALGTKALGSEVPKRTRSNHSLLTKSKGTETSGRETRKGFIPVKQHREDSALASHRLSPKCCKYFWVYVRRMWDRGHWVHAAGREGQVDHCLLEG